MYAADITICRLGNPGEPPSPILSVFTLELREQLLAVAKFGRLDGAANVVGTSHGKTELLGQPELSVTVLLSSDDAEDVVHRDAHEAGGNYRQMRKPFSATTPRRGSRRTAPRSTPWSA